MNTALAAKWPSPATTRRVHESGGAVVPLLRAETTAERFSLIAEGNVSIAAEPGFALHVHKGALRVREQGSGSGRLLRAGERFVARRIGVLEVTTYANAELRVAWPSAQGQRLSPGLQPVATGFARRGASRGAVEPNRGSVRRWS